MTIYPIDTLQHVAMIHIGRQTEAGVERIGFDCSAWLARWPGMELSVWVTAPGADTAYEVQPPYNGGNIIVWDVSGSDTITPGKGYVEVLGMVDGRRKLSARVQTMVVASGLAATSDPPESQQPWFERAMEAVEGVPEKVKEALAEAVDPTLSVSGMAADAKATGAKIAALSKEIEAIKNTPTTETVTETGVMVGIKADAGAEITVESDDVASVTLMHRGKNLARAEIEKETTINGITFTPLGDGKIKAVGTATTAIFLNFYNTSKGKLYLPAGTYTASTNMPNGTGFFLVEPAVNNPPTNAKMTFTLDTAMECTVYYYILPGKTLDMVLWAQVEQGKNATGYEKYNGETLSATLPVTVTAYNGINTLYTDSGDVLTASTTKIIQSNTTRFDSSVWGLPVLALNGDTSAMTKDDAVNLSYVYGDMSGTCSCKWQGSSSLAYDKKNYTIKFDNAFEAKEGWGAEKKYCLKANFIDHSHVRNLGCAMLWGQTVRKRSTVPTQLASLPNCGAVDGFPVIITLNGEFHGLYTMNIPKDGWMLGMGNGTNEAILCADAWSAANNLKAEAVIGEDFDLEYVTDENNAGWVTTSLNRLINACINSDGSDLDTTVAQYLDWQSAIDYYIFTVMVAGIDMTGKNYLLYTFDGTKWYFGAYDMDSTFGLHWNGRTWMPAPVEPTFASFAGLNRVMELIKTYKKDALKARFAELSGVFSENNIALTFGNFVGQIPSPVLMEDAKKWPTIPNTAVNNLNQIRDYFRMRLSYVNGWLNAL